MRFTAYGALLATIILWAVNWIVGRAVRDELTPAVATLGRIAIAIACVAPFAVRGLRERLASMTRRQWKLIGLAGLFGGGVHLALQWLALRYTTATSATLFTSCAPIFILILASVFLDERIHGLQWLGIGTSFAGIALIVCNGDLRALASLDLNVGDLFAVTSMLMFAAYTIVLKVRSDPLGVLQFLLVVSCIGVLTLLPWAAWELANMPRAPLTARGVLAFAYSGIGSFLLAFLGWNYAVPRIGAARTGAWMHLMPAFAVALAVVFLGEYPQWFHFAGITLILSGVALSRAS